MYLIVTLRLTNTICLYIEIALYIFLRQMSSTGRNHSTHQFTTPGEGKYVLHILYGSVDFSNMNLCTLHVAPVGTGSHSQG
jgi:hypothetical protein